MTRGRVSAPAEVRRAIVAHARRERPNECCGLLLGAGRHVRYALPMRNVAASPTRYRIDDAAHIKLRRLLREIEPPLSIVGVYHSHPGGGGAASPTDIQEAMYPDWLYVIVGLKPRLSVGGRAPEMRAFQITNGRATPVGIAWVTRRRALRP